MVVFSFEKLSHLSGDPLQLLYPVLAQVVEAQANHRLDSVGVGGLRDDDELHVVWLSIGAGACRRNALPQTFDSLCNFCHL